MNSLNNTRSPFKKMRKSSLPYSVSQCLEHIHLRGVRIVSQSQKRRIALRMGGWRFGRPCDVAASKGNQILGLIRRNITFKEKANHTSV